jgi:hypothetical protein
MAEKVDGVEDKESGYSSMVDVQAPLEYLLKGS